MLKKRKNTCFAVQGLKHWSRISKNTQNKVFSSLFDPWLPSISKSSPSKMFPPVILLLLTQKNADNFTVQQQNSRCRRQISGPIYLKFSVEENELNQSLLKRRLGLLKIAKFKQCSKNVNIHLWRSKGYSTGHKSVKLPKTRFLRLYLIQGYLQFQNDLH